MASYSVARAKTATLTSTTADEVTLTQGWPAIEVTNHDGTTTLYVRFDGVTAVSAADNTTPVLPASSKVIAASQRATAGHVVSVVGSGNVYTVEGVN